MSDTLTAPDTELTEPGLAAPGGDLELADLIEWVQENKPEASDVQFVGGGQMWVHANGREHRTRVEIGNDDILAWADEFADSRGGADHLETDKSGTLEKAVDVAGVRLRMTWRRQLGGFALNVRILPSNPPGLSSPRFANNPVPQDLVDIILHNTDGLVLFEGPTGSGKSTLQAALVREVNEKQQKHIYTIEDPVEFVHESQRSLITQREVHTDVDSFLQGLITAKRSKPGIILLGELRDPVTMRTALESAGSGHLVMATSHASAAPEAVSSFIGSFPSDEQNEVSQRLSESLRAVIVQKLIPSADGKVVPVREMITVDSNAAGFIREPQSGKKLRTMLQSSEVRAGTFSRDADLLQLFQRGLITESTALEHSISANDMKARLERGRR
ncbi:type IV pilus twitching motility protein PilT [Microbacterium ginsengisoli]|nr:Flp pilus assembly complex ATPase component TadA [Microbacteriaceae bacterium K1510]